MKKTVNITFKIFFSIGVLMLLIAGYLYYKSIEFKKNSLKTTAEVIELVSHQSNNNSIMYSPKLSYVVNGEKYFYTSNTSSSPSSYDIGEKVTVFYDPKNPNEIELDGLYSYFGTLALTGMGLLFSIIGIIPMYLSKRKNKKEEWLKLNGKKIQAKLVGVTQNNFYQVNGRSPYVINAQFFDDPSNKIHNFKSEDIWFDPTQFIQNKETVDVIIERGNFEKYFVDVSFLPQMG